MRHRLREYQEQAVRRTLELLPRRILLVAPTGSGKTTMAVAIIERYAVPVLWLAHRRELIGQAAERIRAHGISPGIIMAGQPETPARVQVASKDTLARRQMPHVGLIIVDEAHHVAGQTYQSLMPSGIPVVGLTATPYRLDGRGLGNWFDELVIAADTADLCADGTLHAPRVWASSIPDLRGVRLLAGDYAGNELASRANQPGLVGDIVQTWRRHAAGRRTVAFACDVAHSQAITAAFVAAGVPCEHIDGTTADRSGVAERLRSGRTMVVSNCQVWTEGVDIPELECAIIARPTASLALHRQMIGRIMRACLGKDGAIVLDHAGNHHVHGLVTRRLEYTLTADRIGYAEPLGLRRCRECGLMFDIAAECCPECGWVPEVESDGRVKPGIAGRGTLSEFDDSDFEYRRQIWNLLEAERIAAGFGPGWSRHRYRERFGEPPIVAGGELVEPGKTSMDDKRLVYADLVKTARQNRYRVGWASHRYRAMFGVWPKGFVTEVKNGLA